MLNLNVWHEQRQVGRLWRHTTQAIGFRYDPEWIADGGFAISRSLPLAVREFAPEEGIAQRWFANLLPEGTVREHIVRELELPNTDFDLLHAIGGECAGALSVLPIDRQPSGLRQYRPLTETDVANLVARRGAIYAAWPADKRPRLSLAGAQDKRPVLMRGDQYFLSQGEAPSSHILKFDLIDYRHPPAYETFTTQLAAAIDTQHLLRWQIFNVLAGNSDSHAKNLSLLHWPGDTCRLAPFYDLVCTRAIERIDYHLAFDVGGERNPSVITPAHWESLARQCDVRPQFLDKLVRETADALRKIIGPEREEFEARYGAYPALQRIEKVVNVQCRRLAKR